jgi:hypothetical protein
LAAGVGGVGTKPPREASAVSATRARMRVLVATHYFCRTSCPYFLAASVSWTLGFIGRTAFRLWHSLLNVAIAVRIHRLGHAIQ